MFDRRFPAGEGFAVKQTGEALLGLGGGGADDEKQGGGEIRLVCHAPTLSAVTAASQQRNLPETAGTSVVIASASIPERVCSRVSSRAVMARKVSSVGRDSHRE